MKKFKKLMAFVVAMIMTFAMTITAFADPASQEANLTGHTYDAYQIFKGTQTDEENDSTLASVQWGDSINAEVFLDALQSDSTIGTIFAECTKAADVANAIGNANWVDNSPQAKQFAKLADANKTTAKYQNVSSETVLDAGYYLIVDTTSTNGGESAVKNLALLQLTKKGTLEIQNKTDVPEVEKKVDDKNDSATTEDTVTWQDSADYDIGDDVPFKLTGTLPTNYDDYTTYKYVFHDTLANGLTYNGDAKVFLDNENGTDITSYFTIVPSGAAASGGGTLTVSCDNLKNITGVTKDSKIIVTYTAELNNSANIGYTGNENKVYLEYSNNPNANGSGETGHTPEDKVIIFTYKLEANKIDGTTKTPLKGAGFTLYKYNASSGAYEAVGSEVKGDEMTTFVFSGLDDGRYKLVETTVPSGYNQATDIEFVITALHDTEATEPKLTMITVNNNVITVEKAEKDDYYTGVIKTNVENNKGSTLPETGGMGTTIFYVVGAILVLGAGILLITRRRMNKAAK